MKKVFKNSIKHIALSVISFAMIFPMLWMVLGSVKTSKEAMDPTMILPDIIHLENVIEVVKDSPLMKYSDYADPVGYRSYAGVCI